MKRQRVDGAGGSGSSSSPSSEEEMEYHAPMADIVGDAVTPVAQIRGFLDVCSVVNHSHVFNSVYHYAILGATLDVAPKMVRKLRLVKAGEQIWVSNLIRLLQAAELQASLSRLSVAFDVLDKGLVRQFVVWEIIEEIRALGPLLSDLQPQEIGARIQSLLVAVNLTLQSIPAMPADRHRGLNTAPSPMYTLDFFTGILERVRGHLGAIKSIQEMEFMYPEMETAAFDAWEGELPEAPQKPSHISIRGFQHFRVVCNLPPQAMLERFCVCQLYLSDSTEMAEDLRARVQNSFWSVGNLDRTEEASGLRLTLLAVSNQLLVIRNELLQGRVSWASMGELSTLAPTFPSCDLQTGLFRDRAVAVAQGLNQMLAVLPPAPPQQAPQGVALGVIAFLIVAVVNLQRSISDLCATRIEYPEQEEEPDSPLFHNAKTGSPGP